MMLRARGSWSASSTGRDPPRGTRTPNHSLIVAWDGMPLTSDPANFATLGPDLAESAFSVTAIPGRTSESIYEWTGKNLGWDIYGSPTDNLTAHGCNNPTGFDTVTSEWCPDHGKPLPVEIPNEKEWDPGPFYSGSPSSGKDDLAPGKGTLKTNALLPRSGIRKREGSLQPRVFPGGMIPS